MFSDGKMVTPLERIIYLRTLPFLGTLPAEELAAIADYTELNEFKRGDQLFRAEERVETIHILIDGEVEVRRGGRPLRRFGPRDTVGFMALLSRSEEGIDAIALQRGTSLTIRGDALYELFEDNFSILQHTLVGLATVIRSERMALVGDAGFTPGEETSVTCPKRVTSLMERILIMRRSGPFSKISMIAMAQLARRTSDFQFEAGHEMIREGSCNDVSYRITHGEVVGESANGLHRFTLGPGDTVGITDVMAEQPAWYSARTVVPTCGLVVSREAILDTYEDHFDMATQTLEAIAETVLALFEKHAAQRPDVPMGAIAAAAARTEITDSSR